MSEHEQKHEARIHIDQHKHQSPNPTTGTALYQLGNMQAGLELFREVTGDREDKPIENGPEIIHLKEDEHFHSGPPKIYTIYVNGPEKRRQSENADIRRDRRHCVSDARDRPQYFVHDFLRRWSARQPGGLIEGRANCPGEKQDDF